MYFLILNCLLFLFSTSYSVDVVIVMGPSCAGKSTVTQQLCKQLNAITTEKWCVIDFDEVEENIELLIGTANKYLCDNINVIIDTNTYQENMANEFDGASIITKVVVSAPLSILLERDVRRTQRLNRSSERADRCRQFVVHSFEQSCVWPRDLYIDTSLYSVQECCVMIVNFLNKIA